MKTLSKLAIVTFIAVASAASAVAQHAGHAGHAAQGAPAAQDAGAHSQEAGTAADMSDGEIRKVDKAAGKITIRHGELKNLGMPAMTMTFRTKDPAMLDQVKVGDSVKFVAEEKNGVLTVVQLQAAK